MSLVVPKGSLTWHSIQQALRESQQEGQGEIKPRPLHPHVEGDGAR